jgi:hypothetical protein
MRAVTGYEFADRLARSLGMRDGLASSEFDQIVNYLRPINDAVVDNTDLRAEALVGFILGRSDVSPSNVSSYVDMLVQRAQNLGEDEEQWTLLQFAEEMAKNMSTSPLTDSEAWQILDNVDLVGMRAEQAAVPIAAYLIGRANKGPSDVSQCVAAGFDYDG